MANDDAGPAVLQWAGNRACQRSAALFLTGFMLPDSARRKSGGERRCVCISPHLDRNETALGPMGRMRSITGGALAARLANIQAQRLQRLGGEQSLSVRSKVPLSFSSPHPIT
jgi:hypothetical protein